MDARTKEYSRLAAAHDRRARMKGIALMCGALACFAGIDASAKYLSQYMDTVQVVWARYLVAFLLSLVIFNPLSRPGLLRTARPWLQCGRSLLVLVSTVLNFIALQYLQLDQTMTIMFSTPFVIAALAGPLLGEWIGWRRWTAIGIGFLGVLLVTRPGAGGIHPAALLVLLTAVCYAFYNISTRVLARTDSTETTLFYSNVVGVAVMCPVVPFAWTTPGEPLLIALMVALGAFGVLGHYLLIAAHRLAPAAILAPFIYVQLVWMILAGYLVFGDLPNSWTLAGSAVVIGSGLYVLYRERKVGRASSD